MGNIGAAIARRGRLGFNMPVIYSGNSRKTELEQELGAQMRSLDALLAEADFVWWYRSASRPRRSANANWR